jgi:hypothetical protein
VSAGSILCYVASTVAAAIAVVDGLVLQLYDRGAFYLLFAIFLLMLAKF